MPRRTWIYAGAGGAAVLALLAWAFAPRPVEVELATASTGLFETTVEEDARTRLVDRYVLSAPLAGRLQRITLREGDRVAAGDAVATLLPLLSPMLDARTQREQAARVAGAEAALARAGTRVRVAQVALEQARTELSRTEQLAQQGFLAPTKIDGDRLAVRAALAELDTATDGVHVARHELEQARAASALSQGSAQARPGAAAARGGADGAFVLRAPVAGRVMKVHLLSEATVALGTPLVDLGDTARLEVLAELLSSDALQAQPGREVRIERWGGPTELAGRVRRVEPSAFTKVSALGVEEQRVNVVIDITSPAAEWAALGDGYRVGVRIVTRSEAQALRVPVSAVFPLPQAAAYPPASAAAGSGSGAYGVFVLEGGRARLQPVTLVARNGTLAWLGSGLKDGAQVIVYPPAQVADGTRVAARPVTAGR